VASTLTLPEAIQTARSRKRYGAGIIKWLHETDDTNAEDVSNRTVFSSGRKSFYQRDVWEDPMIGEGSGLSR
jgi:hypothetical protein